MAGKPLGRETVVRLRQVAADGRFGVQAPPAELVIEGCVRVPRTQGGIDVEMSDQRNTVIVGETLFLPGGTDVQATDRFRCSDGHEYTVEGEPGHYRKRKTNIEKAVMVALQRVEG